MVLVCLGLSWYWLGAFAPRELPQVLFAGHSVGSIFRWQPHRKETKLREFSKGNLLQNDGLDSLNRLWLMGLRSIYADLAKKHARKCYDHSLIIVMTWLYEVLVWYSCKGPCRPSWRHSNKAHRSSRVQMSAIVSGPTEEFVQNKYSISRTAHVPYKSQIENVEQKIRLAFKYYQILPPQHFWDQSDTKASSDMLWQQQPSSHVVLGRA